MSSASFETLDRRGLVAAQVRNDAGVVVELLDNGAPFAIRCGPILVSQVLASPLAGGLGNVYVRSRDRDGIRFAPLLGPAAPTRLAVAPTSAAWAGAWDGLDVTCTLRLARERPAWAWTVRLANTGDRPRSVDVVLAQDVGLAAEAAVRTNELYTSQYLDHTILRDPHLGYVICTRQNLPQNGAHPWLVHACMDGATGFLTDGFQLYGLGYRATRVPVALTARRLPNRRYQYEVALPTLQSRTVRLAPGESSETTFVAAFAADHPGRSGPADLEWAREAVAAFATRAFDDEARREVTRAASVFDAPRHFASRDLTRGAVERFAPRPWRHEERLDGGLASFFRGADEHVVTRAKELVQERPTGHILRTGAALLPDDGILTVTAWMSGVFGSQLALGNSAFNKLSSVVRNPLGALADGGRRIFVKAGDEWELLGLPSAFAMRPAGVRWYYDDGRRALAIALATFPDDPLCLLDVEVVRGEPAELLIVDALVAGRDEYDAPVEIRVDAAACRAEIRPGPGQAMRERYPDAAFHLVSPDAGAIASIGGDGPLYADGVERRRPYLVVRTRPVRRFRLAVTGSLVDPARGRELADRTARPGTPVGVLTPGAKGRAADDDPPAGLFPARLGGSRARDAVARLDDALPWLVHDALVHLSTPHGLEQSGGAAWGLRDVCQGPVELLLATGHPASVREVLRTLYGHQDRETGDWPQWFMVDRYRDVHAPDSHADIVHWPLHALCDYVEATGDLSILDDRVGYADQSSGEEAISSHAERQLDRIERSFVPGTALLRYGGGDWEDTLQPADPAMAERLVSSWTVELAYETLERYRVVCERAGQTATARRLGALCDRIRADFQRWLVPDGVVTGLAEFDGSDVSYLLHPRDRRTGVTYRLLPMTRGILSGLLTPEQATRHLGIIRRRLRFPDGVRLMDRPMAYRGGVERIFRRAESAANFGREIGLQYVHAHLRYVEAMARLGLADEAFDGLLAVCPVGLVRSVANALPRQANAYFSSSDAAFADRYEASRRFGALRTGRVGVKGGWRVYSSGPGLFVHQLVGSLLGLRARFDDLLFDPVLPRELDGLALELPTADTTTRYVWHVGGDGFAPSEVRVNGRTMAARRDDQPYRAGGLLVRRADVAGALDRPDNLVEIIV